jgi:hypothetical protein
MPSSPPQSPMVERGTLMNTDRIAAIVIVNSKAIALVTPRLTLFCIKVMTIMQRYAILKKM